MLSEPLTLVNTNKETIHKINEYEFKLKSYEFLFVGEIDSLITYKSLKANLLPQNITDSRQCFELLTAKLHDSNDSWCNESAVIGLTEKEN